MATMREQVQEAASAVSALAEQINVAAAYLQRIYEEHPNHASLRCEVDRLLDLCDAAGYNASEFLRVLRGSESALLKAGWQL